VEEHGRPYFVGAGQFVSQRAEGWASLNRISREMLPFETGTFDMVHLRFVELGVPEYKWGDLLEEASRVMKKGGMLEIVEVSYILPPSSPSVFKTSFETLLHGTMVQTCHPCLFRSICRLSTHSAAPRPFDQSRNTREILLQRSLVMRYRLGQQVLWAAPMPLPLRKTVSQPSTDFHRNLTVKDGGPIETSDEICEAFEMHLWAWVATNR
jgi:hypothetical protein